VDQLFVRQLLRPVARRAQLTDRAHLLPPGRPAAPTGPVPVFPQLLEHIVIRHAQSLRCVVRLFTSASGLCCGALRRALAGEAIPFDSTAPSASMPGHSASHPSVRRPGCVEIWLRADSSPDRIGRVVTI
jgi:hypothetical protein